MALILAAVLAISFALVDGFKLTYQLARYRIGRRNYHIHKYAGWAFARGSRNYNHKDYGALGKLFILPIQFVHVLGGVGYEILTFPATAIVIGTCGVLNIGSDKRLRWRCEVIELKYNAKWS